MMRKIDWISRSPNNYIFQNDSNKTTFGGILFLVYLIIALFILLSYLIKFFSNNPFEVTSFISEEKILNDEQQKKFIESEKYNPKLKFKFFLVDRNGKNLSDRFILYDYKIGKRIERGEIIEKRVNDIHIDVLYMCENKAYDTCEVENKDDSLYFYLIIQYQGYYINPYDDTPIIKLPNNSFHSVLFPFNSDIKLRALFKWTIIRFEDTKGIFKLFVDYFSNLFYNNIKEDNEIKENDIYIGGKLKGDDTMIIDKYSYYTLLKNSTLLFLFDSSNNNIFLYEDYIRKENTMLDILADVFSLLISFYNFISFIFFNLYSKKF